MPYVIALDVGAALAGEDVDRRQSKVVGAVDGPLIATNGRE